MNIIFPNPLASRSNGLALFSSFRAVGYWLLATLLLLVSAANAQQGVAADASIEAIKACVQSNSPTQSLKQTIEMSSVDRSGGERTLDAVLYARQDNGRDKVMIRIKGPVDLAGVRYLLVEKDSRDEMYMFLPALNRVRRVSGSQMNDSALFGTDFSYEDVKQLSANFARGEVTLLGAETYKGRDVFKLSLKPAPDKESAYSDIISLVDRVSCTVLATEFFSGSQELAKRMTSEPDSLQKADGRAWIAEYRMEDIKAGTHTDLIIKRSEYDTKLSSRLFSSRSFQNAQ